MWDDYGSVQVVCPKNNFSQGAYWNYFDRSDCTGELVDQISMKKDECIIGRKAPGRDSEDEVNIICDPEPKPVAPSQNNSKDGN